MKKVKKKHLIDIAAILLLAVVIFCGVQIWREYGSRRKDADNFAALAEQAQITEPYATYSTDTGSGSAEPEASERPEVPVPALRHDISFLIEQNSDCIGWLTIEGTTVDYPVMHTPSYPQKYINLNFDGEHSKSGVPFLDYRCSPDSDNLIIFGHNMRSGTMFAPLKAYLDDGYLAEHPVILLETLDGAHMFNIFAVVTVDKLDSWYNFIEAQTEADFTSEVRRIIQNARYTAGDVPELGDRLLTLSTCYGSSKMGRLLIIAVEDKSDVAS